MNFGLILYLNQLVYKSNNIGEIKLPCNTPLFTLIHILLLEIFYFAFEYNNFMLPIISSEIPCSTNLLNILLLTTLS